MMFPILGMIIAVDTLLALVSNRRRVAAVIFAEKVMGKNQVLASGAIAAGSLTSLNLRNWYTEGQKKFGWSCGRNVLSSERFLFRGGCLILLFQCLLTFERNSQGSWKVEKIYTCRTTRNSLDTCFAIFIFILVYWQLLHRFSWSTQIQQFFSKAVLPTSF